MRFRALLIVLAAFALSSPASAGVLIWSVSGAAFDDGGILTGSFGFDADTASFGSIALTTTDGSTRSGAEFVTYNPCCGSGSGRLLFYTNAAGDLTGTPVLGIDLTTPMTNAGGTIPFDLGVLHAEMSCMTASCIGGTSPTRYLISGSITTVPEPGTLLLAGPLAAWALRRRWRSAE